MNPLFRAMARKIMAPRKGYPTDLTPKSEVEHLIRSLWPLRGGKELIRLGPSGDGGYLVPDDLEGIVACYSPGVSTVSGFEWECAERGMQVFLADASVDKPAVDHPRFHFTKKFIGAFDEGEFTTLSRWVDAAALPPQTDFLLQMDIEGYEYETLLSTPIDLMQRFRIIVIEFHWLDQLWNRPFFRIASRAVHKLLLTHACVHIHPNNCRPTLSHLGLEIPEYAEFTFYRRDRITDTGFANRFPHPLDCDNTDDLPVPLPKCWYGSAETREN
ncbi:MAG: FkbM family methyltransferase [candidate division KSB1 bacterium]|nr:FkbM family methyltransferase [candidate division KSB1 bacterium]